MYDAADRRFMAEDLIGINLANTVSYNSYAYVWNNPVRLVDLLGLAPNGGVPVFISDASIALTKGNQTSSIDNVFMKDGTTYVDFFEALQAYGNISIVNGYIQSANNAFHIKVNFDIVNNKVSYTPPRDPVSVPIIGDYYHFRDPAALNLVALEYFQKLMCMLGYKMSHERSVESDYYWPVPNSSTAPHGTRPDRNGVAKPAYHHYSGGANEKDAADLSAPEGSIVYAITGGTIRGISRNRTSDGGARGYLMVTHRITVPSNKNQRTEEQQRLTNQARNEPDEAGRAPRDSFYIVGDDGYTYYYTHMQPNSTSCISNERRVLAGEPVGKVGNSAAADFSSPHLHISAVPSGREVDAPYGDFFLARDLLPVLFKNR